MDPHRAAKYPFLMESIKFAEDNSIDIKSLIMSSSYKLARDRGKDRVLDALVNSEVSYVPLINSYDCLIEVISYPYARMIVSIIKDRFLTKRYALAEAVRMNKMLNNENSDTILMISNELGVLSSIDIDKTIKISFFDYLRLSNKMRGTDWKLINREIHNGTVYLPKDKYIRLVQNALQDKIESELPLDIPEEYKKFIQKDVNYIIVALNETKKKFSDAKMGTIKSECLPPCMSNIIKMAKSGINLSHSARFAIVSFLNCLGAPYKDIIHIFMESPDFDESKSEYQIKHIIGRIEGTDGYIPPGCNTMETNGICYCPDSLCHQQWMTHPLTYYRIKLKNTKNKYNRTI